MIASAAAHIDIHLTQLIVHIRCRQSQRQQALRIKGHLDRAFGATNARDLADAIDNTDLAHRDLIDEIGQLFDGPVGAAHSIGQDRLAGDVLPAAPAAAWRCREVRRALSQRRL